MLPDRCVAIAVLLGIFGAPPALLSAQARPSASSQPQGPLQRADAAFHAGFAAMQAGNLDQARAHFAEAVRLAPQIPEGHEALAEVLIDLNQPSPAATELEAALKLKPGDPAIQTSLAVAFTKAGAPGKALPLFSAVAVASHRPGAKPVDAEFSRAYARALDAAGKPTQAIAVLQSAVEGAGATAEVFDDLGSLYAQLENWTEAQARFEQALSIDGAYLPARIHLGIVQRQQHDLEAALGSLRAAVAQDPNSAEAQSEYGRSLVAASRDEDAVPALQAAIRIDPNLPGVQNELAMALQRLGRQQEAVPWFEKALQRDPHNVTILTNLGLALTLTGRAKDALADFQQARAAAPPDATLWKDQGVAHVQLSAFDEAISDFQAALKLDPSDPQLHYDLGMAYKFKDRVDDAIAELSRAGQMDPTLQDPPYTLGILYMQIGKLDQAVIELKKAVALRPESGDAWAILGSTLKQDSRLDEARDALQKAVALLPGQPGPLVTLAGVLAEQAGADSTAADGAEAAGDQPTADRLRAEMKDLRAQAAEYRRQGAELARGAVSRQRAAFALNAGNQLLLKGQIADAVARYQEAIAADPTFADPHTQLALAYERQGRTTEAEAERAKAASVSAAK